MLLTAVGFFSGRGGRRGRPRLFCIRPLPAVAGVVAALPPLLPTLPLPTGRCSITAAAAAVFRSLTAAQID